MKTAAEILDDPALLAALLASNNSPVSDAVAASILKNPFVQAYISKAIADAVS